jgi:hypothetical protein
MEQVDWIAEAETIRLSKEIEAALVKLTQKNIVLMARKMGDNITFNEHLTIQRTIQAAKTCLQTDKKENQSESNQQKTVSFKLVVPDDRN